MKAIITYVVNTFGHTGTIETNFPIMVKENGINNQPYTPIGADNYYFTNIVSIDIKP